MANISNSYISLEFYNKIVYNGLEFTERSLHMQKIICKKEYDTDCATLVKKYTYSYFGDPAGYEENLYQTPGGLYFLHVLGGFQLVILAVVGCAGVFLGEGVYRTNGDIGIAAFQINGILS